MEEIKLLWLSIKISMMRLYLIACAYVSVKLAAKAMENAGTTTDSTKLRDALAKVQNFESAVGSMTFNGSGDPEVDLVLLKVENGKYTALNVK